ncbi:uncharacterized protein PRCAT00000091001 [Priceomyces carsonii]|uniref:uncharacterized protein n=1 Tax=Priceomyces carsonii TaxID=28549 RepID=UPI002ED78A2C|nr:unnamed protein product [Priceomyces carsonii]
MSSDEDYSSGEEEIFDKGKKSNVFLGFVDDKISEDSSADLPTFEDSFMGFKPVWLHPKSRPKNSQLSCDNCGDRMALLLQAFAPLDDKLYDRVLYIFGCRNTSRCSKKKGTIKCIRGISKDPKKMEIIKGQQENVKKNELDEILNLENKKKISFDVSKDLFSGSGSTQNPFGSSASENPFKSTASESPFISGSNNASVTPSEGPQKEKINEIKPSYAEISAHLDGNEKTKRAPSEEKEGNIPSYPGYFLYVEKETLKKNVVDKEIEKYKHLINSEVEPEKSGSSRKSNAISSDLHPLTAKMANALNDKYFQAFTDVVKHNPGQVLRYDLGGRPLLYSGKDSVASKFVSSQDINIAPPSYNPSSKRQFELQLMPKAIMDLESSDKDVTMADILAGMAWGTIIVCTDVEDFIPDDYFDENNVAYIEEWCGVQWEDSV